MYLHLVSHHGLELASPFLRVFLYKLAENSMVFLRLGTAVFVDFIPKNVA